MYTFTHLEDFIKNLYSQLSIVYPHEINIMEIARKLNIKLEYWDETSQVTYYKGKFLICINEELSPQEQWQDFAHELGHVFRHDGCQSSMSNQFRQLQENEADNFGYHFYIPSFILLNYEISSYVNIKDGVPFVMKTFNVTEEFAIERLRQFKRRIQQAKMDEEHRRYMDALYPKAPPYSDETNEVLKQLSIILEKKRGYTVNATTKTLS
ncbi:ImmA/IrrE family metallo-endopeptidase [Bacillus sp. FJAT-49736]|uniref:ImmA/IrrE family metallo-endopeptidase n=1 Tax=Bacillus sp. FJAT-49736 TaxID=2833582 RepID=UPI001BC95C7E|nr:ImmA/IrrE family metallo-endopeptidase [Bacillus sp. FJAT-49736]MBS4172076.1 ImmA/IrrE family metallo-endopeptidase [Bacillus sp. FJAT-49736]